jgi:hypothetical protein
MEMITFTYNGNRRLAAEFEADTRTIGCLFCFQVQPEAGYRSFKIHKMQNIERFDADPRQYPELVTAMKEYEKKKQPKTRKLEFESAAMQLHDLINEADADTLAAMYCQAFGAVANCWPSNDMDCLEVEFEDGFDDEMLPELAECAACGGNFDELHDSLCCDCYRNQMQKA